MLNKIKQSENNENPVLTMIQQIKDGQVNPQTLGKEMRQCCVEVFLGEGYGVHGIAQVLKCSDKTIRRDIAAIREKNALQPSMELVEKIVGEMLFYSRIHRDHLMRLARDKNASVSERALAEYYAAMTWIQYTGRWQSMGYLPTAPQAIVGKFEHSLNGQENLTITANIRARYEDLIKFLPEADKIPEEIRKNLDSVKGFLQQEDLSHDQPS